MKQYLHADRWRGFSRKLASCPVPMLIASCRKHAWWFSISYCLRIFETCFLGNAQIFKPSSVLNFLLNGKILSRDPSEL